MTESHGTFAASRRAPCAFKPRLGLGRMSTDPNADPYDEAIASLEKLPSRLSDACGLDSHLPHQCARLAQRKSAAPTKQRSRYRNSRRAPIKRSYLSGLAPLRHGGERGSIHRGRTNFGSAQLDCMSRRNSEHASESEKRGPRPITAW